VLLYVAQKRGKLRQQTIAESVIYVNEKEEKAAGMAGR